MQKLEVTKQNSSKRLDLFLTLGINQYSRSGIRKILDLGAVRVNGKVEYRPNYKVETGDVVEVNTDLDMQRVHLPAVKMDLEVVYLDEDIVVVNKPIGLKVHPAGSDDSDSLLNGLYHVLADNLTGYGVTLVNRIDRDTSGLVVAAISPRGAWHYSKLFANAVVKKEYLAVVSSKWEKRYGKELTKVGNFLNYDWKERKQSVDKESGDYALTYFQMLSVNHESGYALIRALPKTGRTHQIRIHLSYQFLPILGDTKYEGKPFKRLMLHSHKLGLVNPDGEEFEVVAEPDAIFYELTT